MRNFLPSLATLLVGSALVHPGAAGAFKLHVHGPRTVYVGDEVRFPTAGFKPHQRVTVNLAPRRNRGGNCCGIDVIRHARADANGKAILHFVWPEYFLDGGTRIPWVIGEKADVLVLTPGAALGRRVVRVLEHSAGSDRRSHH